MLQGLLRKRLLPAEHCISKSELLFLATRRRRLSSVPDLIVFSGSVASECESRTCPFSIACSWRFCDRSD